MVFTFLRPASHAGRIFSWQRLAVYGKWSAALLPLLFWLCFFLLPLGGLFSQFLIVDGGLAPLSCPKIIRGLKIFAFTFGQAQLSALGALALALPLSLVLGRFNFYGRPLFLKLAIIPYILPTTAVAAMFKAVGFWLPGLMPESGLGAIILGHIYYNFPLALIILCLSEERQNPQYVEAARNLGATAWQAFWRISWPQKKQALYAAWLLVFFMCFLSFGVPLILGNHRNTTLEVAIYRAALFEMDFSYASFLALLEIILALSFFLLLKKVFAPVSGHLRLLLPPQTVAGKLALNGAVIFSLIFMFGPMLLLIISSFKNPQGCFFLTYWQAVWVSPKGIFDPQLGPAFWRSLKTACLCALFSTSLALLSNLALLKLKAGKRAFLAGLYSLPWLCSAVVLGLALFLFFLKWPLSFQKSALALALVHCLVAWPISARFLWPTLAQWPYEMTEAARTLGARPWALFWQIIAPWLLGPILTALTLSAMISLGEFGASLFLAHGPQEQTISTAIGHFLSQGGTLNYGRATVLSTMMLGLMLGLAGLAAFLENKIMIAPKG